jgi:hypothetical protein
MDTAEQLRDELQTDIETLLDKVNSFHMKLNFGPDLSEADLNILDRIEQVRKLIDVAVTII